MGQSRLIRGCQTGQEASGKQHRKRHSQALKWWLSLSQNSYVIGFYFGRKRIKDNYMYMYEDEYAFGAAYYGTDVD
ncbi:uncharacterized protein LOC111109910 isoform X4 [Crassostrea virginica]